MPMPRKVTDEVLKRICRHLEKARPLTTACRLEGMKPDTVIELMERLPEVREQIDRARAVGESVLLDKLEACIEGGSGTSGPTWWLEKLYPKRWGRNAVQRTEISGPKGQPQKIDASVSIEGLVRIARQKKEP